MENSTTTRVMGKRKILLKLSSGKLLCNALYVHSLHRNIVSGVLLNKVELKTVVAYAKVIISHNGVFAGK